MGEKAEELIKFRYGEDKAVTVMKAFIEEGASIIQFTTAKQVSNFDLNLGVSCHPYYTSTNASFSSPAFLLQLMLLLNLNDGHS